MSAEDSIQALRGLDFKDINATCSKNNISVRIDEYTVIKFNKALATALLLITQPIEIAIPRETKANTSQALKDVKKVLDALYLQKKDQKYKTNIDQINEIISHSKLR